MRTARATSPGRLVDPPPARAFFSGAWRDGDRIAVVGGCSLGDPAPIALSDDGGATWSLADFTSRRDFSGVAVDARGDLWVHGAKGTLVTRRGGRSKRLRTTLTEGIGGVCFGAAGEVLVCGTGGSLARSLDDGRTWAGRASDADLFFDLCGDGAGTLVAVGRRNAVLRSDDGARWEVVAARGGVPAAKSNETLSAVRALGLGRFLAGGDGLLLRSDDGGRAWRDVTPACLAEHGGISSLCVTPRGVWYVGSLQRIARSDDEGATWTVEHALAGPLHRWVYALSVGDDGRGVAAGPHGTVYLRSP